MKVLIDPKIKKVLNRIKFDKLLEDLGANWLKKSFNCDLNAFRDLLKENNFLKFFIIILIIFLNF